MNNNFPDKIFNTKDREEFQKITLEVFNYQADNNKVYNQYLKALGKDYRFIRHIEEIPFLPVEFFRTQKVITDDLLSETTFESSTTTGITPSRHFVHDLRIYETSFQSTFRYFYGDPGNYFIAALLPSYTERENSSLVYMMNRLIKTSRNPYSGFYKNNVGNLISNLQKAGSGTTKTLLFGVSFALLDLAEKYSPDLSGIIVMETGGMKGRRNEITRDELHEILREKFNVPLIHSEYGMTELLSQAYSAGGGIFYTPPWMNILIRDPADPLSIISQPGATGGINIIDLANLYSCSFIATSDLGRLHPDGGFEVLGRFDNSEIRGCNLLAE